VAPCLQTPSRHPGTEDDNAIAGLALDIRDPDRNRLERDRAVRARTVNGPLLGPKSGPFA